MEETKGWTEFLQNTSFHGLRYTTAGGTRRIAWLMFVLVAVGLFGFQVFDRAQDYFQHKTNINVQLIYKDRLSFPAVTICNQNTFRLTKSVENNKYHFISDVFSGNESESMFSEILSKYNGTGHDFNSTGVHFDLAQDRDVFIDRCYWANAPCNRSLHFEKRLTDFGVCFTFNNDGGHPLNTTQPGASFGLSLLINIEQYEYMKGPQSDAGVKVLLHDQLETPLMKDLGFAVAPGSHTLVGVRQSRVSSLNEPWGLCDLTATSYPTCKAGCNDRKMDKNCCTNNETDDDACNNMEYFMCKYSSKGAEQPNAEECGCGIPCEKTLFEPKLSYAQLSKYTAQQVILRNEAKMEELGNSFQDAREVSQNVVPEVVELNQKKFTRLENAVDSTWKTISTLLDFVKEKTSSDNCSPWDIPHQLEDILEADANYISDRLSDARERTQFSVPGVGFQIAEMCKQIENYFLGAWYDRDDMSILKYEFIDRLKECLDTLGVIHGRQNITVSQCREHNSSTSSYWKDRDYNLQRILGFRERTEEQIHEITDAYLETVKVIFINMTFDDFQQAQHDMCWNHLILVNQSVWNISESLKIVEDMNQITASDLMETLTFLGHIVPRYSEKKILLNQLDSCKWIGRLVYEIQVPSTQDEAMNTWKKPYSTFGDIFQAVFRGAFQTSHNVEEKILPVSEGLELYQTGNITFFALAEILTSRVLGMTLDELKDLENELQINVALFLEYSVENLKPEIHSLYEKPFNHSVPVLPGEFLWKLELLVNMRKLCGKEMAVFLRQVAHSPGETLNLLISQLFEEYYDNLKQQAADLYTYVVELDSSMSDLQIYMEKYVEESEVNEQFFMDNFLQIDIFYRQLSYEQVTEQKAFELLSLFSEVGGFMGLLLGASILTVCELIDYIIISARMKCNAADKNTKKQQDNRRKKGTNGNINDGLEVAEVQVDVKD